MNLGPTKLRRRNRDRIHVVQVADVIRISDHPDLDIAKVDADELGRLLNRIQAQRDITAVLEHVQIRTRTTTGCEYRLPRRIATVYAAYEPLSGQRSLL